MDRCKVFEIPSSCWHRFYFLQKSLQSIHERVQSIFDQSSLDSLIDHQTFGLNGNASLMKPPCVAVLGIKEMLDPEKLVENASPLKGYMDDNVNIKEIKTEEFLRDNQLESGPNVLLLCLQLGDWQMETKMKEAQSFVDGLTEAQRQSSILFLNGDSTAPASVLQKLKTENKRFNVFVPDSEPNKRLCDAIQEVLEKRFLVIFERMFKIFNEIMTSNNHLYPKESIYREISGNLRRIINCHSIESGFPLGKPGHEHVSEPIVTEASGLNTETSFLKSFSDSGNESNRRALVRDIFQIIRDVVQKQLSQRLDLSLNFVEKCLKKFDFEKKYLNVANVRALPARPSQKPRKPRKGKRNGLHLESKFMVSIYRTLLDAEYFVRQKADEVARLRKPLFEISHLLRTAKVPTIETPDDIPALPKDLQDDLLRLNFVSGCGRFYGKLVIQINQVRTTKMTKTIKRILKNRNYPYKYSIERTHESFRQQGKIVIASGGKIRVKETCLKRKPFSVANGADQELLCTLGTLGGFVFIDETLYAITCAHVLEGGDGKVGWVSEFQDSHTYLGLCRQSESISGNGLDSALIEISETVRKCCETQMSSRDGIICRSAPFKSKEYDKDLLGKRVFKVGASSGYTDGLIVSTDFKRKCTKRKKNKSCTYYEIPENPSIVVEPSGDGSVSAFSTCGDSGSLVCGLELKSGSIEVISIVIAGAYHSEQGKGTMKAYYTVTSSLQRNIECLEKKTKRRIRWPEMPDD